MNSTSRINISQIIQLAKTLPGGEVFDMEPPSKPVFLRLLSDYCRKQPLDMEQLPTLLKIIESLTDDLELGLCEVEQKLLDMPVVPTLPP